MKAEMEPIDKSTWGDGPWQTEPDRLEFEHAGLPCLIIRAEHAGHLCGYAAVPPGHPAHGKDYNHVEVEAHGGLTYSRACSGSICHVPKPGHPDNVWWLGFDCAHLGDVSPRTMSLLRGLGGGSGSSSMGETYKDVRYVRRATERLAEQLAAMAGRA